MAGLQFCRKWGNRFVRRHCRNRTIPHHYSTTLSAPINNKNGPLVQLTSVAYIEMPVQDPFTLPNSIHDLPLADDQNATFFLNFIASISPETKQSWCPDVRSTLPLVVAAFSTENAQVGFVHVGQKPEYATPSASLLWSFENIPYQDTELG